MRSLLAASLLALCAPARAQFCPGCIQNSAAPQTAQINIGTATIRGSLTASTATITYAYLTNVNITNLSGNGSAVTALNASNLASGTVPSARISGAYSGLTGAGTLASGTWQGTAVGTQYGGTGQNFVNVLAGSVLYFDSTGHMATLSGGTPEALLQTNGAGAPVWTSSPAVSGLNIYGLQPGALVAGNLPTSVVVSSNSIPYVDGASVIGNISGSAGSYTGTVQLSQLAAGTLPNSVVASSITSTSIYKGTYGDSSHALQLSFGTDGRASTVTVLALSVPLSDLQSGTLASGVLVPAANVQAGALGGQVVASSVALSGVTPGTYGGAYLIPSLTIGGDGRITAASQTNIINNIVGGSGTTSFDAVWNSSYTLTTGNLYEAGSKVGISTSAPQATLDVNGNLVVGLEPNKSTFSVTGALFVAPGSSITMSGSGGYLQSQSSITTTGSFFGDISHVTGTLPVGTIPNTVTSSFTVTDAGAGGLLVVGDSVTASYFIGDGRHLTNVAAITVPASGVLAGSLGSSVIASSIALAAVGSGQLAAGAVSTATVQGVVQVLNGGTGATTASGARSNLVAAQSGLNSDLTGFTLPLTATSSLTVTGAGGVGVTYGLTAATGTFSTWVAVADSSATVSNALVVGSDACGVGPLSTTTVSICNPQGGSPELRVGINATNRLAVAYSSASAAGKVGMSSASLPLWIQDLGGYTQIGAAAYPSTFTASGNLALPYGVTAATATVSSQLTLSYIESGTQCLQINSSGQVSGTGSACASTTGFAFLTSTQTFSGSNTFSGTGVTTTTFQDQVTFTSASTETVSGNLYVLATSSVVLAGPVLLTGTQTVATGATLVYSTAGFTTATANGVSTFTWVNPPACSGCVIFTQHVAVSSGVVFASVPSSAPISIELEGLFSTGINDNTTMFKIILSTNSTGDTTNDHATQGFYGHPAGVANYPIGITNFCDIHTQAGNNILASDNVAMTLGVNEHIRMGLEGHPARSMFDVEAMDVAAAATNGQMLLRASCFYDAGKTGPATSPVTMIGIYPIAGTTFTGTVTVRRYTMANGQ